MKRASVITALLLLGLSATPVPAARPLVKSLSASDLGLGLPREETPFEPGWSAGAGALFLQRSANASLMLAETPPPESAALMSASDIDLGFEAGPIVSLAKQVNETTTAEILYFGIDGWSGSTSVTSAGGITTSRFDAGATLLDQVDATFSSQIHNIEVNCQRTISARLQWLLGFRWTELDESAGVLWDGRSTGSDYCTITSGAENKLYGLQLGLSGTLWQPSARLHLDGFFKAGAFANRMATNWSAAGTFATISSGSRSVDRTSVLGEIGLLGTFDVTERIALTAGYQLMWIDGVATGFSPLGSQDVDTVFYHGLRLMVEARW